MNEALANKMLEFDDFKKNTQAEIQKKNQIKLELDMYGRIKKSFVNNIKILIKNDDVLRGKIRYNDFTYEEVLSEPIKIAGVDLPAGCIDDNLAIQILLYFEEKYNVSFTIQNIEKAITSTAKENRYNPVKDYLEASYQIWDEQPRINDFLPTYLGAEDVPATRLAIRKFMLGCISKVYDPKTKVDVVLDLVGDAGTGKTTLLRKLAFGYYVQDISGFDDKDDQLKMLPALIVNDDEMVASKATSMAKLKAFISQTEMLIRAPYGRRAQKYPQNFMIARTTNEETYQHDKTGGIRRFLPVSVNKSKQIKHPASDDLDRKYIGQLWGEAVTYWKNGERPLLTQEEEQIFMSNRAKFDYVDEIDGELEVFLIDFKGDIISKADLARKALGEHELTKNKQLANKMKYYMDNRPDWKESRKLIGGKTTRCYERVTLKK